MGHKFTIWRSLQASLAVPLPLIPIWIHQNQVFIFHPNNYFWIIQLFDLVFGFWNSSRVIDFSTQIKKLVKVIRKERSNFPCCNYPRIHRGPKTSKFVFLSTIPGRAATILLVFRCSSFGVGIIEFLAGQSPPFRRVKFRATGFDEQLRKRNFHLRRSRACFMSCEERFNAIHSRQIFRFPPLFPPFSRSSLSRLE